MKRDGRRFPPTRALAAMAIAASAALAAGCASANDTSAGTPPQSPAPSAPAQSARAPSPSTHPAAQTPKQRAESDAAAILASFAVPAGAVRLPGAPSAGKGALKQPFSSPASPDLVDDVVWWEVPGQPLQALAWEKAHLPARFSGGYGPGTGSYKGKVYVWSYGFTLPAITGVLNSRGLTVEAVDAGGGKTDLRVDAQVTWIPVRPASEVVPSAARAVTLKLLPNMNVHTKLPGPVTITDPGKVRALTSLIDGLPLFPPGGFSCPAAFGDALVLTFRAQPGGPALAVATVELSGCEGVDFTIGGKAQPGLGGPDEGRAFATRVLAAAGLHWRLP